MWDGANPQSSARRRRCFGCRASPFGAALYSRLPAAREARGRSSPSRVTIADAGEGGCSPSLPSKAARRSTRTVARFPQFRRAQSAHNAQLLSQVRSTKSAPPARRPSRCVPVRPCPSHPQLAAWQAVWRGHPPSRLQGALPMKAPGSIRLGNKRAGAPGKPGPGEIAVDIDRKKPHPRQSVRSPRSHRRRRPQRRHRALPRQIRSRPQMRWPDERRDRSARRTRPKGRAPGLHVLVLAEALPRHHHHRRDQTAPRMRRRTTRRSRKERESLPRHFQPAPRYIPQMSPPKWIKPQLCKLAAKAPSGPLWVHEIKFDGYRIAARIDQGAVQLLTRSGLDWTAKYPATAAALAKLKVKSAYLDGELCGVRPDGVTSFELMQQASDRGGGRPRLFRLRSPRARRRRPRRPAAPRPQDTPRGPPREAAGWNRIQRP